jgi:hypothetical protein
MAFFLDPPSAPLFKGGNGGIFTAASLKSEMLRNMAAFFKKLKSYLTCLKFGSWCLKVIWDLVLGIWIFEFRV